MDAWLRRAGPDSRASQASRAAAGAAGVSARRRAAAAGGGGGGPPPGGYGPSMAGSRGAAGQGGAERRGGGAEEEERRTVQRPVAPHLGDLHRHHPELVAAEREVLEARQPADGLRQRLELVPLQVQPPQVLELADRVRQLLGPDRADPGSGVRAAPSQPADWDSLRCVGSFQLRPLSRQRAASPVQAPEERVAPISPNAAWSAAVSRRSRQGRADLEEVALEVEIGEQACPRAATSCPPPPHPPCIFHS
jgi:hypothetical protein